MWYMWAACLLVSCALVSAGGTGDQVAPGDRVTPQEQLTSTSADSVTQGDRVTSGQRVTSGERATRDTVPRDAVTSATTRAPPRTLDRKAAELAWRTWLQSPESNNQNAPPRRIITKSLFITPLNCPEGQRIDRDGCVKIIPVDKSEHERLLLSQLNAFFTASPGAADVVYDYGEDEPGPLQLSIPINLEAQAAPLQGLEPSAQAQEQLGNFVKIDKKENKISDVITSSLEAELELLQLQHSQHEQNDTTSAETTDILNHNVLIPFDKPKRDTPTKNSTETNDNIDKGEGQKEVVFGHVNVDPILQYSESTTESESEPTTTIEAVNESSEMPAQNNAIIINNDTNESNNKSIEVLTNVQKITSDDFNSTDYILKKDGDKKLNPESDYADIGEAIKLISRYAEVTTDDNFSKDQKKYAIKDDSILGTRTKLQYRRNKIKPTERYPIPAIEHAVTNNAVPQKYGSDGTVRPKNDVYYRYPWRGQNSPSPPPDYPFRHIQDYWPGQSHVGGVYNSAHENPRRHHHNYPHYFFRPHGFPYGKYPAIYPGVQQAYSRGLQQFVRRAVPVHGAVRSYANNQDLYTLLGLRHWFSSEGTSKR